LTSVWVAVGIGFVLGTVARLAMLRTDFRQYPSYPHGYVSHLALGLIAAFTGAVVVPALILEEFTAVTFLVLVAQQFREIRGLERKTLERMEETELVRRGAGYIEDIAKVFEARNYLTILTALAASSVALFFQRSAWDLGPVGALAAGTAAGLGIVLIGKRALDRQPLGRIAVVREGQVHFKETLLYVDDILIMEIGLAEGRDAYERYGRGVVIEPKDDNARATLANFGQRQAIAHDVSAILGVRKDVGTPEFTPLVRLDLDSGRAALAVVPIEPDIEPLLAVVRRVPVIEGARTRPLATRPGRQAAD
jgi:hypothetical protein